MSATPLFVLGGMKCGSTTLTTILLGADSIRMLGQKEEACFLGLGPSPETFISKLSSADGYLLQSSTLYMQRPLHRCSVQKVDEALDHRLRALVMLRDPLERAISHWRHWTDLGYEHRPLDQALAADGYANPYVWFGDYQRQLGPWMDVLGRERLGLIRLQSLLTDTDELLERIEQFLGLAWGSLPRSLPRNNRAENRIALPRWVVDAATSQLYNRTVRRLLPRAVRRSVARLIGRREAAPYASPAAEITKAYRSRLDRDLDPSWFV